MYLRRFCAISKPKSFWILFLKFSAFVSCFAILVIVQTNTEKINLSENKLETIEMAVQKQNKRKQIVSNYCSKQRSVKSKSGQNFVTLVTNPSDTIGYCHVPKVASSGWMMVFAKANNIEDALKNSDLKGDLDDLLRRGALHNMMLANYSTKLDVNAQSGEKIFKFIFLRHPFERLVSAYHDKFLSLREQSFIQPLIDFEAGLVLRFFDTYLTKPATLRAYPIHFEKFVRFVLHEITHQKRSYGSLHWLPFTTLCKICTVDYDFVGKLESMESDVKDLMLFLDGSLNVHLEDVLSKKNALRKTSDDLTKKYFSQISKDLILQLYKAYESDFQTGGYPFPEEYLLYGKTGR